MTLNDTAWKIIDYWTESDYGGDKAALIDEVGNLDDYAARIADTIERHDLDTSDVSFCASMVELNM
jgi:hypothetical protein